MAAGIIDPTKVCFSTILEYEIMLFLVISGMKSSLRSQASMALPKNILGMKCFQHFHFLELTGGEVLLGTCSVGCKNVPYVRCRGC